MLIERWIESKNHKEQLLKAYINNTNTDVFGVKQLMNSIQMAHLKIEATIILLWVVHGYKPWGQTQIQHFKIAP